jgi:cell division protease FtsH
MLTPEDSDPVHKVTIIPRGMALGVTQTLPVEDRFNYTKAQILAVIRHAMGGRAAEEMIFDHLSTGASNDLEQATGWAHRMVCEYGMSDALGPVSYGEQGSDVFLGRDMMSRKEYSDKKAEEIDCEVSSILRNGYDEAKHLLEENRDILDRVAEALLERETLETAELDLILKGEPLPQPVTPEPPPQPDDTKQPTQPEAQEDFPGGNIPDPEPMPS